jgi:hypothetical protein
VLAYFEPNPQKRPEDSDERSECCAFMAFTKEECSEARCKHDVCHALPSVTKA